MATSNGRVRKVCPERRCPDSCCLGSTNPDKTLIGAGLGGEWKILARSCEGCFASWFAQFLGAATLARMRHLLPLFLVLRIAAVCQADQPQPPDLRDFREAIQQAVWDRVISGSTWWVEHDGVPSHGCLGSRAKIPEKEPISEDTIFDLASLTKVVATAPSAMLLLEQGRIELGAPVRQYLPEFSGEGREAITVRHLLTHTSGLKPGLGKLPEWSGHDTGIKLVCATKPEHLPDEQFRYSDLNFILLGEIVQRVSGETLDAFARKHVHQPLAMKDTMFLPSKSLLPRIAPTERDEHQVMLRGVVHDPTSRRMGGVAGHAGLFSTAADLARYCRMILNQGELEGVRVLKVETVQLMTAVQTPNEMREQRALGWDVDTSYSKPRGGFPVGTSFGHTGFTGTCLWMDPASRTFYVFLSSRLHASDPGSDHRRLYEKLGLEVAKAALPRALGQ